MLQGYDIIAGPGVCKSAEVIPAGITLPYSVQKVQGFPVVTAVDEVSSGFQLQIFFVFRRAGLCLTLLSAESAEVSEAAEGPKVFV